MPLLYHGTSAPLFGRFSLDHALEGEGKVKFGWGVYVTKNLLLMELREGNGTLVLSRPLPLGMTVVGDLLERKTRGVKTG